MKKVLITVLVLGLTAVALAIPVQAGRRKPVRTTLYLHGNAVAGETEVADTYVNDIWHPMDTDAPAGNEPKSQFVTNYVVGPNWQCSGNGLLPTWRAEMSGTVVGTVKVTLHTVASPAAQMAVSLFPDAAGGCDDAFQPPVATKTIEVEPGAAVTEVVFRDVRFKALGTLVLQLNMAPTTPGQVRVFYDSVDMNSKMTFKCIPRVGSGCA